LSDIQVERRGAAAIIWFDRPDRLNAFRGLTFDLLHRALDGAASDPAVRGVVMTGRGRGFCAGEDLDEMAAAVATRFTVRRARLELTRLQDLTRKLFRFPKMVVAAINGPAVGFGAELPLACRSRVASPSAYLMFPEARRGMFQTNGAFHWLPRMVGQGRAAEWLLTGRRVSAEEAWAAGLVNRLVGSEDLIRTGVQLIEETRLCWASGSDPVRAAEP
jgi:enoyl-CoA hydratase/carnithine racemase